MSSYLGDTTLDFQRAVRLQRAATGPTDTYLLSVVELVALRRVAPRPAAQWLPANRAVRGSHSAAARGGVVAARQPLPLNTYTDTVALRHGRPAITP